MEIPRLRPRRPFQPRREVRGTTTLQNKKQKKADTTAFTHKPLNLNEKAIRVLRLLPGSVRSLIQCSISHIPIQDHEYVCLSYMWGNPSHTRTIRIDGRSFRIRRSLYDFLTIARKLDITDALWIDALCIDQSNIAERNHQVQLMAEIYSKAKHVILWPGQMPSELRDTLQQLPNGSDVFNMDLFYKIGAVDNSLRTRLLYSDAATQWWKADEATLLRCMRLPYWTRVWVFQEIFLPRTVFILVGQALISWDSFAAFFREINTNDPATRDLRIFLKIWERKDRKSESYIWGFGNDKSQPDRGQTKLQLSEALDFFKTKQCKDTRDRWYGLMSVIDGFQDFAVDYKIGAAELVANVFQHVQGELTDVESIFKLVRTLDVNSVLLCIVCASRLRLDSTTRIPEPYQKIYEAREAAFFLLLTFETLNDLDFRIQLILKATGAITDEWGKSHSPTRLVQDYCLICWCNIPTAVNLPRLFTHPYNLWKKSEFECVKTNPNEVWCKVPLPPEPLTEEDSEEDSEEG